MNKLSSPIIAELSFLTLKELQTMLKKFNDTFNAELYITWKHELYITWKHIARHYTDEQIIPLLPERLEYKSSDPRTREEKLQELKSYYVKDDTIHITANDIPALRRGRRKKDGTLRDRIFELLDNHKGSEMDYKGVLESGITNIAENTFKTLLSGWRKEHGIKIKRGRKANG